MKVRLKVSFWYGGKLYQAGDVVDIRSDDYEKLKGVVEMAVDDVNTESQEDKVERKARRG